MACDEGVVEPGTLCAACWRDTAFVTGSICDQCGAPQSGLPGDGLLVCDDCRATGRPWGRGRAVMAYGGTGRRLVLGLKYGDRHDIARPAGRWLLRVTAPLLREDTLIAPVPLHRLRLLRRRYNQSALLAWALARESGRTCAPDLLVRTRRTTTQEGLSRQARIDNLAGSMAVARRWQDRIAGRPVLLIDDVMTSGATLSAAAEACFRAGADSVDVAVLARVGRDRDT